jgi:Exostosin family
MSMKPRSTPSVKVLLASCETGPGSWRGQEVRLRECHALSDHSHTLVTDPHEADIILLGNARQADSGARLLENELLRQWPDKCFTLSDEDHPPILVRGIHASARRSILFSRRIRSGSYCIYPEDFKNPFVDALAADPSQAPAKAHLFSFIGRDSHPVRHALLRMKFHDPGIVVEDSSDFDLWGEPGTDATRRQQRYATMLAASRFSLCPRGAGTASLRLFESLQLGVAPVILADDWPPPRGPDWHSCAIFVKERHVRDIERILTRRADDAAMLGANARRAFEEHFSKHACFNFIVRNCLDIRERQWLPERTHLRLAPLLLHALRLKRRITRTLRRHPSGHPSSS